MKSIRHAFYMGSGYLSGACMIAIMLIVLAQIVGRLFGMIVPSAEDFSAYSLAASIFFGLAYTFREGGHIRVTLVIQRWSAKARRVQETGILLFAFALTAFMAYYAGLMVWESYEFEEVSYGYIPIPLWIPQLPLFLGLVAFNLAVTDNLISVIRGRQPAYQSHEGEVSLEAA